MSKCKPYATERTAGLRLLDELLALLDVLLQVRQARLQELSLLGRELADGVDLLDTLRLGT